MANDNKPKYARLTVKETVQRMKDPRLLILIGLQAGGKSTLADELVKLGYVRLNADQVRAELNGSEESQHDNQAVYALVEQRLHEALLRGKRVVLDLTNLTHKGRAQFLDVARQLRVMPHYLLMDTPLEVCLQRNRARARFVPEDVIISASRTLRRVGLPTLPEGSPLTILRQSDEMGFYLFIPKQETPNVMRHAGEPLFGSKFDILGDVHGCYDEMLELLFKLGYRLTFGEPEPGKPMVLTSFVPPEGRTLLYAGDLVDRGPHSELVLGFASQVFYLQKQVGVLGNHDHKLMRALKGNGVKVKPDLQVTVDSIKAHGQRFVNNCLNFLISQPVRLESEGLILVHAAYKEGIPLKYAESLAMIGEVDGSKDADGHPIRLSAWEENYTGGKVIVHGHVPVDEVVDRQYPGGRVINIDTSCCFGGKLTALRFPEMEFVSVPARRAYSSRHGSEVESE